MAKSVVYMGSATDFEVYNIGSNVITINNLPPDNNGNVELTAGNINSNNGSVQNVLTTLRNDLDDLGDQVVDIQVDVSKLKNSSILDGKTLTNSRIKDVLNLVGDEQIGEAFSITFLSGTAQIATNNGLDFLSKVNFSKTPTVEGDKNYEDLASDELLTKKQASQAISNVSGTHFEKWVIMGKPDDIELTTTLKPVYWPATTRFPNLPPEDIEPNQDGTGVIFKKAGLIHIKRNVSLGGVNTENLYYEMRINGQTLEPLQTQSVSIPENSMNYSVEFYWQVSANQEVSIWANCLRNDVNLNYKGVCTVVEYL